METPVKDIFVARQPIFDARHNVYGYELLYRADGVTETAGGATSTGMSSSVIVDGVLGIGLGTLTEGQTAFINLSEDMILEGAAEVLEPDSVVVELLETVEPTPEVVAACRALVDGGYRLALDDFAFRDDYQPLLEMADFVKIDIIQSGAVADELVERLKPYELTLLAEKVENSEVHERCVKLGFELFQGFHYFRPETLTRKDLSTESVAIVRLLNLIQDATATDRTIEEAFRSDPSLTYKLLRIVNSAALGGRGVQDIGHALRLLGRDPLYRWLCLLLMTVGAGAGDVHMEMIKAALLRGRMCEMIGNVARTSRTRDVPAGGSLFLVGLFAHMDQLLGVPLEDILRDVDVTPEVRGALLERAGPAGTILKGVDAYVDAEWARAEADLAELGLDPDMVPEVYLDAIAWASSRMAFHRED